MKSNMKPDLVILEGADKSGKSTIYQAFRRATSYQPLVIDRFIGSNIVYDQLHGRTHSGSIEEYYEIEDKLSEIFNPLLVYLHAPISLLIDRSTDAGDIRKEEHDISNIPWYYNTYLNHTSLPVLSINTRLYTINETVEMIINKLKERKK